MGRSEDGKSLIARPSWRMRIAVGVILLLGLVFVGLGFILVMDPHWAYQVLPVK